MEKLDVVDNGGRRFGIDRRQISIRKKGSDRRSNNERRSGKDRRGKWTYQEDGPNERRCSFHVDVSLKEAKNKVGPNEPCPCESGNKYKKCCGK